MGSGEGEATKPSNSLIRATVAALTLGPVHWRGERGEAALRARRGRRNVRVYIVVDVLVIVVVSVCLD